MPPAAAPPSAARRRRLFRLSAIALTAALAFVALEVGLRIHHARAHTYEVSEEARRARSDSPWTASDDPDLVYVHRAGKAAGGELRIEAHGALRPENVRTPKPPGVRRVVVLGDSLGAALYLEHTERFPALLEQRLSGDGAAPVEVLNLCVNGYDTRQEARLLETVVAELEPDAVLLLYCINDPAESVTPIAWFRDAEPPVSYALHSIVEGVTGGRRRPLAPGEGPSGRALAYWERAYDRDGDGWAIVMEGLDRVRAWTAAHDVPVLVAIAPLLMPEDPGGASTAAFRAQVIEALDARGLPYLDLQSVVTPGSLPVLAHDAGDIYHFSAIGHAALSNALYLRVAALLEDR